MISSRGLIGQSALGLELILPGTAAGRISMWFRIGLKYWAGIALNSRYRPSGLSALPLIRSERCSLLAAVTVADRSNNGVFSANADERYFRQISWSAKK